MNYDSFDHDFERGMQNRRKMLGDAWADRSLADATGFDADFQNLMTRFAWNEVWGRPGLPHKMRRVVVLVSTLAQGQWEEFDLHARAALLADSESRLTPDELKEVLLQTAVCAGVPAAGTGFARAKKILAEVSEQIGYSLSPATPAACFHPGSGRECKTDTRPAIRYSVREPRSGDPARHTVVLSHALGCDLSMWDELANRLAAEYRVISYDHRGHGGSDVPAGPYSMADLVEDAVRVLRETNAGPVVWIGLSLGGLVGQELALRHPALLSALVVANSTSGYPEEGQKMWQQRIDTIEAQGLASITEAALQRFFHPGFHQQQPATVDRFRRRLLSTHVDGYLGCCHAARSINTTEKLGEIKVPALIIASELDQGTPMSFAQTMADRIPQARLVTLPQAAHLSVIEQPQAFADAVTDFLRRV